MTNKFLLTILITSLGLIGGLTPKAMGQERPKCYLIDDSGELTDLTDICNASQKRSPETNVTNEGQNIVNNNINTINSKPSATGLSVGNNGYVLEEDNLSLDSNLIQSSYFVDNELGIDYTAYTRTYKAPGNSLVRQTRREQIFRFDPNPSDITSILRRGRSELPFLIYRYQI